MTFLRYSLSIGRRSDGGLDEAGGLEILSESLVHVHLGDASRELMFDHKRSWRSSAVVGKHRAAPFISTGGAGPSREIRRHQDGKAGRVLPFLAANLPRTVLSVANAAESPTAVCARREMQSWQLLQLEPSALREPDDFRAPASFGPDGSHLAATLYRLATGNGRLSSREAADPAKSAQVYARIANRLSALIDDVVEVGVDVDRRRELLTLEVTGRDKTPHPARSLSDGTLRFLALAVIELDPHAERLLCLEEPENGVHPERIPAMLRLIQDIATNVEEPLGADNPLRQVVVNTHSPAVVSQVPEDTLLVAELVEAVRDGQRFKRVSFGSLPGTWRSAEDKSERTVPKGTLLAYLNPVGPAEAADGTSQGPAARRRRSRRVIDRPDLQPLLPFGSPDQ